MSEFSLQDDMPETLHATPALPRNVKVLGLTSLLNDVASEAIYPLLPAFLLNVLTAGSPVYLGLIEGCAESVASILKLWAGGRSDQTRRRKGFILFGYTLAALVRPLLAVTVAPWQLLVIRVSDRIGKGVRTAPRDALIADSTDPSLRGRAFGFHRAMDHLGAAIGPLLAAAFLWQWPEAMRTLFLLAGLPGLAAVVLLCVALREQPVSGPRQTVRLTLHPFDRNFRVYLVALVLFTLGNSSDLFLLAHAERLGVPVWQLPLLWCAFHILKSVANLLLGRAVDRVGPRPLLCLGWLVHAGVYLAFALASQPWHAWVFFLTYALFYGLSEPSEKTLVTRLAGSERVGLAFGWYNAVIGIAALPASLLFGAIYEVYGAAPAFGVGAGLALAATAVLLAVRYG
jgi:MFS family permease